VPARELRLGTRGSQLALWQAKAVAEQIASTSGIECRMVVIKTIGDHLQDRPLSEVGGKRLFVKEIEDALLRGEVDLAVHSSKDMPAALPTGLTIAGVLPRADPLDVVVLPNTFGLTPKAPSTLEDLVLHLGPAASIGTGSVRRIAQLTRVFTGACFAPIRGNLDTRLRKLDTGEHDALVLAGAGLRRLGFAARISWTLAPATCVPAPGQGIVAIEIREDNEQARRAAQAVNDAPTGAALRAERALVEALGGGCQTPIGAFAWTAGAGRLELIAAVAALDGSRAIRGNAHGLETEAAALGARLGAQLIADGAGEILIAASAATQQSQVAILKSATMTDD
jgi:hydroxymethylbilane synthase